MIEKVLTIAKPWASLLVDKKTMDVRTWKPTYRGPILLHAAARSMKLSPLDVVGCSSLDPLIVDGKLIQAVPHGCIFARANLAQVIPLDRGGVWNATRPMHRITSPTRFGRERPLYGWIITDVQLTELVPVKGQLGLWKYDGEVRVLE